MQLGEEYLAQSYNVTAEHVCPVKSVGSKRKPEENVIS